MSIPFTQFLLPDGRERPEKIDRPAEIEAMATSFIEAGGRYTCEILSTGEVSLAAEIRDEDIACIVCPNAVGVALHVDNLVRASARHLSKLESSQ
jgi:hypothetical protein